MYLLVEQILNGTVTLQIITTGIEADTFPEAILKVKALSNFGKAMVTKEDDKEFSFYIEAQFPCFGRMENVQLKII